MISLYQKNRYLKRGSRYDTDIIDIGDILIYRVYRLSSTAEQTIILLSSECE